MGLLRKIAAWGVMAFIALVFVLFARPMYRQGEPTVAGKRAEDFATDIGGKPGRLSDLRGKVVVLNFWATWCPPCVEETPSLNKLQKYIESRNALVLGVSVDEDPNAYEKFLKDQAVIFPTFLDGSVHRDPSSNNLIAPIANEYGTTMYPETYIIDRNGKILRKFYSSEQWDSPEMLAYFDSILGQS
jgi:cytochrome c biogenesis protein CcmG, thiol:disulfide interchange protein DsbE